MNVAEGLAREIMRVSYIRKYYEEIGVVGAIGLVMIEQSLEKACIANGTNDVVAVLKAYEDLKGISE